MSGQNTGLSLPAIALSNVCWFRDIGSYKNNKTLEMYGNGKLLALSSLLKRLPSYTLTETICHFSIGQSKNLYRMHITRPSTHIPTTNSWNEMETIQKTCHTTQRTFKSHCELHETYWHTNLLPIDWRFLNGSYSPYTFQLCYLNSFSNVWHFRWIHWHWLLFSIRANILKALIQIIWFKHFSYILLLFLLIETI